MTSAAARGGPRRGHLPFQNGVKPVHIVVLVIFILIKFCYGGIDIGASRTARSASEAHANNFGGHGQGPALHPKQLQEEQQHHAEGGGHSEGYQVFHMEFERVELPFIIALWIFVSSLAKIGFHMTPKLHHIFPESCLLIVVGIVIGFLLFWTSEHDPPSTLTPDVFFLFMLPPIIFDAGYFMPNRLFFDHLGTILLMAVVGTIFNAMTIGAALYGCGYLGAFGHDPPGILETFLFSSLISAVDPVAVLAVFEEIHVDEILYIVVFGESLLNDAVTVVLYHMFEAYVDIGEENIVVTDIFKGFASFLVVALGGTFVGIIWGYVTGFVTRFTNHARILEPLFVFTMAYLSYLNAEIFHLSGIMAITFCGITMKNYVERNISSKSQTTLKYAMKMLSGSSETIIFMFLGVATIHDNHDWNWAFVILTITFCTVFRIIGVLILAAFANTKRLHKLSAVDQFVMMYGGLRGAVAFALVLLIDKKKVPHADMFVTTTIAMVYWTVFVQGITIKPLVKFLNVKVASEKDPTMNERIAGRFMDHVVAGMEGILGELGNLRLRDMYKRLDDKYIKPCLLRENHVRDPKIIETYENLTERDALEFMKRNPTQFVESMSEIKGNGNQIAPNKINDENFDEGDVVEGDQENNNYHQSQRDLDDSNIHHMLSENLFMPRNRPRRLSYSRHEIKDEDTNNAQPNNYKVHMQVRRMMSENKNLRNRSNKAEAKPSGNSSRNDAHEIPMALRNVGKPVSGASKKLQVDPQSDQNPSTTYGDIRKSSANQPKTWMLKGGETNEAFIGEDEDISNVDEPVQSAALPWRRTDDDQNVPRAQDEFPPWINNEEYLPYTSPTNTVIGTKTSNRHSDVPSVIGFFRRDSQLSNQAINSSRRNSELEIQHQSSLNEVELESRRQKRSLRTKNIRNPAASTERRNTLTEVIPENTSPPPYEINEKTKF